MDEVFLDFPFLNRSFFFAWLSESQTNVGCHQAFYNNYSYEHSEQTPNYSSCLVITYSYANSWLYFANQNDFYRTFTLDRYREYGYKSFTFRFCKIQISLSVPCILKYTLSKSALKTLFKTTTIKSSDRSNSFQLCNVTEAITMPSKTVPLVDIMRCISRSKFDTLAEITAVLTTFTLI